MGNLLRENELINDDCIKLFDRLYNIAKRKHWTKLHKEQWSLQIISYVKNNNEDFEKVNKLLDTGTKKTDDITFLAFNLQYKRQYPEYVKKYMPQIYNL